MASNSSDRPSFQPLVEALEARLLLDNAPPVIVSLSAAPDPITRGAALTLTANGVSDADGTIDNVKFYVDVNGDGSLDGGDALLVTDADGADGYTASVVVDYSWALGQTKFIAVATDDAGDPSAAAGVAVTYVNALPTIDSLAATASVTRGDTITLTATGVADSDGTIAKVDFYIDVNGDGNLDGGDTLVGSDNNAADGYSATVATDGDWSLGQAKFLAVATDSDSDVSDPATDSTTVLNAVPTIDSLDGTASVVRGDSITLTATDVADSDGTIAKVDFYIDVNGDGSLDGGDTLVGSDNDGTNGYSASVVTDGTWSLGQVKFLAVATDSDSDVSDPATASTTVLNAVPTIDGLDATASATRGDTITLTADNAADSDGTIAKVDFYVDVNGDGNLDEGDTLIGTDNDGTDGYSASVVTDGTWALGQVKFLAVATDSDSDVSEAVSASATVENALPTLGGLTADSPVNAGDTVVLSADNAADSDGAIANVKFYFDADANGALSEGDTLLGTDTDGTDGYSYSFVADGDWTAGEYHFLAIGTDNDDGQSTVDTATVVVNAAPTTTGLDAPDTVVRGDTFTLTALGVDDGDGTVVSVDFYLDTNGNGAVDEGDTLLGTATDGTDGWSIQADSTGMDLGEAKFLAVATDDLGATSQVQQASTAIRNAVPTISDFSPDTDTLARGDALTLSVSADDSDGSIDRVSFFYDTDGNGTLDEGDELLTTVTGGDWSYSPDTQSLALGENTFFAVAVDNDGGVSEVAGATVTAENVLPVVDSLTPSVDTVGRGQQITLTADASDVDGTVAQVDFYLDVDGSGDVSQDDILLGTDSSSAGGWTWTGSTADFAIGDNTVLAVATDNDGDVSDPASATVSADYYSLTWTNTTGNVVITAYDVNGAVDISQSNIVVKWGKNDSVTSITLKGDGQMDGLVLVIDGATSVGSITDARKGVLGNIDMIYAGCGIAKMTILGDIVGYDPAELGLSTDSGSDRVALYADGLGGALQVNGDLSGDVEIHSGLTSLKVGGTTDSAMSITQGLVAGKGMQLTLGNVTSLTLDSQTPIKSLTMGTVTSADITVDDVIGTVKTKTWSAGSMSAAAITSLTVTGDLSAAVTVSNGQVTKGKMTTALGTLSVSGAIDGSAILSAGTIGTVSAGAMRNSNIFAGVNSEDLPTDYTDFDIDTIAQAAAINTVKVNGQSGQTYSYENSSIAAPTLGTVTLKDVRFDTLNTADKFGLAGVSMKSYTRYQGKTKAVSAKGFPTASDDHVDFVLRKLLGA